MNFISDNFSDDKLKKSNSFDDLPSKVYYDAYVCYANEDFDFVENLSKNLETPEVNNIPVFWPSILIYLII